MESKKIKMILNELEEGKEFMAIFLGKQTSEGFPMIRPTTKITTQILNTSQQQFQRAKVYLEVWDGDSFIRLPGKFPEGKNYLEITQSETFLLALNGENRRLPIYRLNAELYYNNSMTDPNAHRYKYFGYTDGGPVAPRKKKYAEEIEKVYPSFHEAPVEY